MAEPGADLAHQAGGGAGPGVHQRRGRRVRAGDEAASGAAPGEVPGGAHYGNNHHAWRSGLERAAEDLRRYANSESYSMDQKVYQAQHDLAWLFPNLGAEQLTTDLVGWLQMDAEIRRSGGASEEAES